jgi:hypothetical protein
MLDPFDVLGMCAMRKIKPGHVHAVDKKLAEDISIIGCRAERANYFCLSYVCRIARAPVIIIFSF